MTLVTHLWGSIDLVVFHFMLESFGALVSKRSVTQQQLVVERTRLKLGVGETNNIWCIFDLVVSKVILGSFGALVSKYPVTIKWLVVE